MTSTEELLKVNFPSSEIATHSVCECVWVVGGCGHVIEKFLFALKIFKSIWVCVEVIKANKPLFVALPGGPARSWAETLEGSGVYHSAGGREVWPDAPGDDTACISAAQGTARSDSPREWRCKWEKPCINISLGIIWGLFTFMPNDDLQYRLYVINQFENCIFNTVSSVFLMEWK